MAHRNCCDYGSCDDCKLDALIEDRAEELLVERGLAETHPGVETTSDVIAYWRAEWNRGEVASLDEDRGEADAYEAGLDRLDAAMGAS